MDKLDIDGEGYDGDDLNDYAELHGRGYGDGFSNGDGYGNDYNTLHYGCGCGWDSNAKGDGTGYGYGDVSDY